MSDTLNALQAGSLAGEKALFGIPTHTAIGSVTTGANTATLTGATGQQWYATQCVLSFAATITAACTLTITDGSGGTVLFQVEIPTVANPAPMPFDFQQRPLHGSTGNALIAALSSPGSIKSAITLVGFKVQAP